MTFVKISICKINFFFVILAGFIGQNKFTLVFYFIFALITWFKVESVHYSLAILLFFDLFLIVCYIFFRNRVVYDSSNIFSKTYRNNFKNRKQYLFNYRFPKQDLLNIYLKYNIFYTVFGTFAFGANLVITFVFESNLILKIVAVFLLLKFILYHFFKTPDICTLFYAVLEKQKSNATILRQTFYDVFPKATIAKIKTAKRHLKWKLDLKFPQEPANKLTPFKKT